MSAYSDAVRATAGLMYYWRMGQKFGDCPEVDGKGPPIGLVGTPTRDVPGPLEHGDGGAVSFNGTDAAGVIELDLSEHNVLTIEFWLRWDEYAANDDLAMEFTPNFNTFNGGFLIDPNNGGGVWGIGIGDSGGRRNNSKPANPGGTWVHVCIVFDQRETTPVSERVIPYFNGEAVPYTKELEGSEQGFFANDILNIMSRNAESLFGAGDMCHLAIYNRKLSAAEALTHWLTLDDEGVKDIEPEGEKNEEEEGGGGGTSNGPHDKPPFHPRHHSFDATVGSVSQIRAAAANPGNAGKVIGIKGGTYGTINLQGSSGHPPNALGPPLKEPNAPVTFMPVPGAKVKIKGMEGRWTRNIVFEGIIWEGGGIELVEASDFTEPSPFDPGEAYRNHHIEFFGCEWMGGALECFYAQAWTDYITFEGCYFHDTDTPNSTDVGYGIHSSGGAGLNRFLKIRRCLFENFSNDMVQLSSYENIIIDRCEMVGQVRQNEASHPDVVQAFGCKNVVLTNNKVWQGGIEQAFFFEFGWGGECRVENNLLMDTTTKKLWWTANCEAYGTILVKNNTLVNTRGCYIQAKLREPLVDKTGVFVVEDNLFEEYDVDKPEVIRHESGNVIYGKADIELDENFVSQKHPDIGYSPPSEVWWFIPPPNPGRLAVSVGAEYPPDRVVLKLLSPDGTPYRWADDDPSGENVISGLELTDEIPGGWKDMHGTLARNPRINWPDSETYSKVKAITPGGFKVWEGFLDKTPTTSGEQKSVNPAGLGNQYVFENHKNVVVGFINAALDAWQEPSLARRAALNEAGFKLIVTSILGWRDATDVAAGIAFDYNGIERAEGEKVLGEQWFWGHGVDIATVMYDHAHLDATGEDKGFFDIMTFSSDDVLSAEEGGPDENNVNKVERVIHAVKKGMKYLRAASLYEGAYVGKMSNILAFQNIKVLADTGLTLQGVWPDVGYFDGQMLEYLINNFCAPLYTDPEACENSETVIGHLWPEGASPAMDIANEIMKQALYDWFVYDDYKFEHRAPGSYGKRWKVYLSECELNDDGADSQRYWTEVTGRFTMTDGTTKTVGPPGSGADFIFDDLRITDPENPALKAGQPRGELLDLGGISTPANAAEACVRFLEEANLLPRSGSMTITGYIVDENNIIHPVSHVRSGDWIAPVDAADASYRKIVSKTLNVDNKSIEIDVDAPPAGLDALLERLQAALVPKGVS